VFEPFFTTKAEGKGTGLGLPTVHGIVHQSGGDIVVYSELGMGTAFKIHLPSVEAEASPMAEKAVSLAGGSGESVLVVEDENPLRRLLVQQIGSLGYRARGAANGGAALLMVEEEGLRPDLIITDVVMPGMSGRVLIERIRRTLPTVPVVFMSGYTDDAIVHHGILEAGIRFLPKPFAMEDLAAQIRAALAPPPAPAPPRSPA